MNDNALERLYAEAKEVSEDVKYSTDDLLDDDSDLSFIDSMSSESKDFMFSKIEKLEDETAEEETIEEEVKETESVVEEKKRGRGRPRKNPEKKEETTENVSPDLMAFLNSVAINIIDDLLDSSYTIKDFDKEQMETMLQFMKNKFK